MEEYVWILAMAALTLGVCFLLDKLFSKVFRGTQQHRSGHSVKLRKRVATFGLLVVLLGAVCVIFYWGTHPVIFWSGWILLLMGCGMLAYYLSFGIFYDKEGFVYSRFCRKSQTYTYSQIQRQQLYNSQGSILVELYLSDGTTVPVQDNMEGGFAFLDYAFDRWLQARGMSQEDCAFYNPQKCCWFPGAEVE